MQGLYNIKDDYILSAFVYLLGAFILCASLQSLLVIKQKKTHGKESKARKYNKHERQLMTSTDGRIVMQQILWMVEFEMDSWGQNYNQLVAIGNPLKSFRFNNMLAIYWVCWNIKPIPQVGLHALKSVLSWQACTLFRDGRLSNENKIFRITSKRRPWYNRRKLTANKKVQAITNISQFL
jgi:hypothetical protein